MVLMSSISKSAFRTFLDMRFRASSSLYFAEFTRPQRSGPLTLTEDARTARAPRSSSPRPQWAVERRLTLLTSLSHARCHACMCPSLLTPWCYCAPSGVGVESSPCSPLQGSLACRARPVTLSCTMSSMHVSIITYSLVLLRTLGSRG